MTITSAKICLKDNKKDELKAQKRYEFVVALFLKKTKIVKKIITITDKHMKN